MIKLVGVISVFAVAVRAGCPNQCSGHGSCGNNDICTCYQDWQGPDCSLRTCPFGRSWAIDASNPHDFSECSGQGVCDRYVIPCTIAVAMRLLT